MRILYIAVFCALAGAVLFFLFKHGEEQHSSRMPAVIEQSGSAAKRDVLELPDSSLKNPQPPPAHEQVDALLHEQPRVEEYFDRVEQSDEFKERFAKLKSSGKEEAADLLNEVDTMESDKVISSAEAVFLKLAIMKKILPENELKQYADKLIGEKTASAVEHQASYLDDDVKFQLYKKREAEIAREVMGMSAFPDGLSKEQYLRKRLDAERIKIYSGDAAGE